MTSTDRIDRDIGEVSEAVLGGLSSAERVRLFATAAAANNDEWIEQIWAHTPRKTYTMPDRTSQSAAKWVFLLSLYANGELVRLETELRTYEAERDRNVALVLLHEALSRLSHGQFSADAYGVTAVPDSWPDSYGPQYAPKTSKVATKFRELWDGTALELAIPEAERSRPYFTELAAASFLAYRTDLSHDALDDLPEFSHSAVFESEAWVIRTVVQFSCSVQTWRLFAMEHLGVSFDEFLGVAQPPDEEGGGFTTVDGVRLDEAQCDAILSVHQLYLDAYADVIEALCSHFEEEFDGVADFDEQATADAAKLAALMPAIEES